MAFVGKRSSKKIIDEKRTIGPTTHTHTFKATEKMKQFTTKNKTKKKYAKKKEEENQPPLREWWQIKLIIDSSFSTAKSIVVLFAWFIDDLGWIGDRSASCAVYSSRRAFPLSIASKSKRTIADSPAIRFSGPFSVCFSLRISLTSS